VKRFLKSFGYAFYGIRTALKTERNLRIHVVLSLVAIGLGIYLNLTAIEWSLVIFAIGLVISAELFNTAIERLGDETANGQHKKTIKAAKDTAAGGVLISAIAAMVIAIVILIVPFFQKILN
jgi:diacylglycerol kinase